MDTGPVQGSFLSFHMVGGGRREGGREEGREGGG